MFSSALPVILGAVLVAATVALAEEPDLQIPEEQPVDYFPPPLQLAHTPTSPPLLVSTTPAPELPNLDLRGDKEKRATGNPFIGYFSSAGYWYSWTCPPGNYFAADPTFGACCASTSSNCMYATGCDGHTALAVGGGRGDCGTQLCDTITIFNSVDVQATGVRSLIGCFESSNFYRVPRSFYRNTFASRPTTAAKTTTVIQRVTVAPSPDAAPGVRPSEGGAGLFWTVAVPILAMLFGILLA
ncbi:uncharacterized protein E0L32_009942 [Thyridium curvatum]|uniref:Uncharacterized protein n=1 Tax=Thyridium curvatum TaxID=1093900 RepID=A0A507ALX1_9PEZI|nr:uncharacterized protein E0L32_009942 [Thyridium curvatum]TPX08603.1 hypothetical protein E0L32_009942 [Thyridium curvatum]